MVRAVEQPGLEADRLSLWLLHYLDWFASGMLLAIS